MNVKNLKQLFQQKGSIKTNTANRQSLAQNVRPVVPEQLMKKQTSEEIAFVKEHTSSSTATSKNFIQQLNKKVENKNNNHLEIRTADSHKIQSSSSKNIANKNFIQQLNKKLDSKPNSETRVGGSSYIQPKANVNKHDKNFLQELNKKLDNKTTIVMEARNDRLSHQHSSSKIIEGKKQQSQLTMQDIITGVDKSRQSNQSLKVRYGINESNPRRFEQKQIFGELNIKETEQDNTSFSDLLQKMLKSINIVSSDDKEQVKNQPRKSRVVNKYEYAQEKLTPEQKIKRVDFVLNVVFGSSDFQHITSINERVNRNTATFGVTQKLVTDYALQQQPKNIKSELLPTLPNRNTFQNNPVLPQRMKSVNNVFLNELSLKLQKKQTETANKPLESNAQKNQKEDPNLTTKVDPLPLSEKKSEAPLTPRQIKHKKTQHTFDQL